MDVSAVEYLQRLYPAVQYQDRGLKLLGCEG